MTLDKPSGESGSNPAATENSIAKRCKTMASTIVDVISSSQFDPCKTISSSYGAPPFPIQKRCFVVERIFAVASAMEDVGMCSGETIKTCVVDVNAEMGPCI